MGKAAPSQAWQMPADQLHQDTLRALKDGDIPAILIDGFATLEECQAFVRAIQRFGDQARSAATTRMNLIGVNFSNYAGATKAGYFDQVDPSYATLRPILAVAGFNPLLRMIDRLRALWPAEVDVAVEPGFGRYFAGGVKIRASSGHLHYDFAPHTAEGFTIAAITDQLGWNLYLDMPSKTGETTIYRRPVPRDGGKVGHGPVWALNLKHDAVRGAEAFTFRPRVGMVAILNTRNPHHIFVENPGPDEARAQTSSFIGRLPDNRLILWS